jgi:hypothetical protein
VSEPSEQPRHPGTTTEPVDPDRELARKNVLAGWALFALFLLLAAGVVAVALIYNAVADY